MTGEESGRIDVLLRKAAGFYEREIKVTVDSMASIIEPILIIILGGLVGSVLIALYMPIFNVGKLMGV
jgi:type IV pilus assembly protein PilC